MFRCNLLSCLMLTLAIVATAGTANAQDDKWHLRFGGIWVEPDADFAVTDSDGNRVVVDAGNAIGLGVAVERRFNRRLGLELGTLFAEPDIIIGSGFDGGPTLDASNGVDLRSITLGLNVHLTPDKPVDLYAGPFLAHVTYGNLRLIAQDGSGTVDVGVSSSDNFTFGAQIGADIQFGDSSWSLNLVGRYLDSSLDVVTGEERAVSQLDLDSLIFGVGVGFRF